MTNLDGLAREGCSQAELYWFFAQRSARHRRACLTFHNDFQYIPASRIMEFTFMKNLFVDKLSSLVPFEQLDLTALREATAKAQDFAANVDLVREGDRPDQIFVMLEGWAYRYKILPSGGRQIVGFMMPGDCSDLHIGVLAEMDHGIRTLTQARVTTIGRTEMDAMLDRHPRVAKAIYVSQLIDEGTMRAWITSMGRRSSIERVAHLVCELYLRAKDLGLAADKFALPVSQAQLADAVGMTAVHLNRVVRELRSLGAMTLSRCRVEVTNPLTLAQIAGFDDNYLHRRQRQRCRSTS